MTKHFQAFWRRPEDLITYVNIASPHSQGDAYLPVDEEESGPQHQQGDGVGDHQRHNGPDPRAFHIPLGERHHQGKIGHHGCNDVCCGIPHPVGGLS